MSIYSQTESNTCERMRYACIAIGPHAVEVRPDGYWWQPTLLDELVHIGELRRHAVEFLAGERKRQAQGRKDKAARLKKRAAMPPPKKLYPMEPYHWAKARASRAGCQMMTPEQYRVLCDRAGGFCEVSGIAFSDGRIGAAKRRPWAPSIDRIDSAKDYHPDNCRLVCGSVNTAMNEYGPSVLLTIARAMVAKHGAI